MKGILDINIKINEDNFLTIVIVEVRFLGILLKRHEETLTQTK